MNKKTVAISMGVVGVVGLGVLVYYLINEQNGEAVLDKKAPESEPNLKRLKILTQQPIAEKKVVREPIKKAKVIPISAEKHQPKTDRVNSSQINLSAPLADEFPLRLASKGDRVERLHVWLMRNYGWTGIINDEFDHATEQKVVKYLKTYQIDEDTYQALKIGKPVYEQTINGIKSQSRTLDTRSPGKGSRN
ncbi:MAG: hypothetical protein ABJQ69_03540 [Ekhidna sp.]